MTDEINKPVFVVGSPRSGTSIVTWCLGQHPNLLALEESDWMGNLAIDLAISYQLGTARGDQSLLSAMDVPPEEFFAVFGRNINELILRHRVDLERNRWAEAARSIPTALPEHFTSTLSPANPKARWVDGTPEYSFYICGLRKLFPNALFIHIVRDVTSVVRSMLNFHRLNGENLAANEQEAYNYWLRAATSCLLAERAYGPRVISRLRYSDLKNAPEETLRSLLGFLEEPFAAECLTPLQRRINSSNVPASFKIGEPQTDPILVERATRLSKEFEETPQSTEASPEALAEIEASFNERVQYVATVGTRYSKTQQEILARQQEQAKSVARTERVARDVKTKKNIIQHPFASLSSSR